MKKDFKFRDILKNTLYKNLYRNIINLWVNLNNKIGYNIIFFKARNILLINLKENIKDKIEDDLKKL